ncbi:peptide deformylase [Candidatus Vidania fulgoroideorum]
MKKIILFPNKILFNVSKKIKNKEKSIKIIKDLEKVLINSNGIGISSPQIGINKRIFLIRYKKNILSFINPKILYKSVNTFQSFEGCLSIPNFFSFIKRSFFIVLEFTNKNFKKKKIFLKGLLSACTQHEIDHLNGILINSKVQ